MAPEITRLEVAGADRRGYTYKSDCWSLGAILYTLLCGKRPFVCDDNLCFNIMSGRYKPMIGKAWDKVSVLAKDLVIKLLQVDVNDRLNTSQILEHPWFVKDEATVGVAHRLMFGVKTITKRGEE